MVGMPAREGRMRYHIRGVLRDICAFVHADADRSLRESNGVVGAIAAENNNRFLAVRTCTKEPWTLCLNSSVIVPRNHVYRDTTLLQGLDRPRSVRLKLILKSKDRM
ncbi:hypothetical protein AnigIFM59636_001695 [Aspergillus niger]|nr:hypothetical protein AnigIFM59636_001695 [Aspergillus niger]